MASVVASGQWIDCGFASAAYGSPSAGKAKNRQSIGWQPLSAPRELQPPECCLHSSVTGPPKLLMWVSCAVCVMCAAAVLLLPGVVPRQAPTPALKPSWVAATPGPPVTTPLSSPGDRPQSRPAVRWWGSLASSTQRCSGPLSWSTLCQRWSSTLSRSALIQTYSSFWNLQRAASMAGTWCISDCMSHILLAGLCMWMSWCAVLHARGCRRQQQQLGAVLFLLFLGVLGVSSVVL